MKRLAYIGVLGAYLIAGSLPAVGADEAEGIRYGNMGVGSNSCGTWTQGRKNKDGVQLMRESWLTGYITAVNYWFLPGDRGAMRNVLDGTDLQGFLGWIDNYCSANPLDSLASGANALTDQLIDKWLAAHPARK